MRMWADEPHPHRSTLLTPGDGEKWHIGWGSVGDNAAPRHSCRWVIDCGRKKFRNRKARLYGTLWHKKAHRSDGHPGASGLRRLPMLECWTLSWELRRSSEAFLFGNQQFREQIKPRTKISGVQDSLSFYKRLYTYLDQKCRNQTPVDHTGKLLIWCSKQ